MFVFGRSRTQPASRAILLVATLCLSALAQFFTISLQPAMAADIGGPEQLSSSAEFSSQYTGLTKKILLAGVELERYSLNYRLETARRPKLRQLRYFLGQETGAACGLAFEVTAVKQFNVGRNHPLKVSQRDLHRAFTTAMVGSIVAGAGSGLELASNVYSGAKRRHQGYDAASATKKVAAQIHEIDRLIAQRKGLVEANKDSPAYQRAVIEGEILDQMRIAFVDEYSHFNIDSRKFFATQNTFFLLNAAYNTVGATAAYVADKSLHNPTLNGASNIMFIVAGSIAMVSPAISVMNGRLMERHARRVLDREIGSAQTFSKAEFNSKSKLLEELLPGAQGSLMPSLPATQRLALYTESRDLFVKQLDNETRTIRRLQEVALQTNILAPPIGGLLTTQGILGTIGYYRYRTRPRQLLNYGYAGAICGTVGTGVSVVGNAAWLLSSMAYENKLKRTNQLPEQLIKARLGHLDDLQKLLEAI